MTWSVIKGGIEAYAHRHGYKKITLQVMDDSKNATEGIPWAPAAEKRLENIPDFIRPMARREIERIAVERGDRKSTRLNSSHGYISYAVFCLKKKTNTTPDP